MTYLIEFFLIGFLIGLVLSFSSWKEIILAVIYRYRNKDDYDKWQAYMRKNSD